MNSEHGGLFKSRAESFARHLQSRLKSLSESEGNTWAEASDTEVYYDIDSSLASPQEEVGEPIFIAEQNRDDLRLQRSDSEVSTYFDSVENFEELAPLSKVGLSKLQFDLLNLKSEGPTIVTNGQSSSSEDGEDLSRSESLCSQASVESKTLNGHLEHLDDLDSCNGPLEMPSLRLTLDLIEKETDFNCDSVGKVLERNNNTENGVEEVTEFELNLKNNSDVTFVEVDTGQAGNSMSILKAESEASSACLFCDIEEVKSSLSNGWAEQNISEEDHNNVNLSSSEPNISGILDTSSLQEDVSCRDNCRLTSENCERFELHSKTDSESIETSPRTPARESSICESTTTVENNVSIRDLLKVLKDEIKCETDASKEIAENTSAETCASHCPNIEIREPSPSVDAISNKSDDEEFDIDTKRKNFRRSSSLKSGKTPPGTPGRKKIVRFADVLGLDLADVKTFLDEVPTVPMSAFKDLHGVDVTNDELPSHKITIVIPQVEKVLVPLFQQPCVQPNFLDRVMEKNVCLENAIVSDMSLFAITGVVRVKNIDFHKSVHVRYSINGWRSFSDLQARYIPNSCDGFSDKFSFVLYAHTLSVGQKMEFAVRFQAAGQQFWDSNGDVNYSFVCSPVDSSRTFTTSPVSLPSSSDETAAFY